MGSVIQLTMKFFLSDEPEKKEFGITIVILPDTPYNAMDDTETKKQKEEINNYVLSFLREQR